MARSMKDLAGSGAKACVSGHKVHRLPIDLTSFKAVNRQKGVISETQSVNFNSD